jgi:hypothetical protein
MLREVVFSIESPKSYWLVPTLLIPMSLDVLLGWRLDIAKHAALEMRDFILVCRSERGADPAFQR